MTAQRDFFVFVFAVNVVVTTATDILVTIILYNPPPSPPVSLDGGSGKVQSQSYLLLYLWRVDWDQVQCLPAI